MPDTAAFLCLVVAWTKEGKHTMKNPATATAPHKGAILAIILVSYFMILLDNSVIFTALPSLKADLGLSTAELAWVQDAYTLVFGGLLLLGARAGDLLGRKRVFIFGLVVFSVASLLIACAPAGGWLIASRAIQGIGAAIVAPSALSLLTASFEGRERARAVAAYAATAGIGASLGMVVGGALASWFSWRAGFFVNVPIGIAMIVLAPKFLPETVIRPGRFDIVGAITATLGVGGLVFAILHGSENGWAQMTTIGAFVLAGVFLVVFVVAESRAAQPIMPLRLFASRERTGAYLTRFLYLGAMIGFFYFTTQYLQGSLGYSPLEAGLAFLPMTLVNFAVALTIPKLSERIGNTPLLVVGIVVTLAGMLWLSRIAPESGYIAAVAFPMLFIGAGQGLSFAPMTTFGIAGTAPEDAGAASGIVNTFHQLGTSVGLGILVAAATVSAPASGVETATSITAEASAALTGGTGLLLLALVITLGLIVPSSLSRRRALRVPAGTGRSDVPEPTGV
jgi:EmrB/QacA subfamily drug resistance transporter